MASTGLSVDSYSTATLVFDGFEEKLIVSVLEGGYKKVVKMDKEDCKFYMVYQSLYTSVGYFSKKKNLEGFMREIAVKMQKKEANAPLLEMMRRNKENTTLKRSYSI